MKLNKKLKTLKPQQQLESASSMLMPPQLLLKFSIKELEKFKDKIYIIQLRHFNMYRNN
jgi:hypothetical protein